MQDVTEFADVIVVGNGSAEFREVPSSLRAGQVVVDFVHIADLTSGGSYDGICW
jgi:GDP-mannose 6-dehydrogenase